MTPGDAFVAEPDVKEDDTASEENDDAEVDEAPTGTDYIANKSSKKFHYPDCKSVKQMKESNKQYFEGVTREYMIEQGYDPCRHYAP